MRIRGAFGRELAPRGHLLWFLALAAVFIALAAGFARLTVDDSYITFRYSQSLAEGRGFVWNAGDDPVEGFTSFLWVVLHAGAIAMGLDPVVVSKVLGVFAGLGVLALVWWSGRGLSLGPRFAFAGALAFSPALALLSVQGMETSLFMLLLTMLAIVSLRAPDSTSMATGAAWYGIALLAALCRPDAVPFAAGCWVGVTARLLWKRDPQALRGWFGWGGLALVVGGAYFAWRVQYFGHLFPNPYYIKLAGERRSAEQSGPEYVASFLMIIVTPVVLAAAVLAGGRIARSSLIRVAPVLLGCVAFLVYLLTIHPVMGYAHRFAMPILGPLLVALLELLVSAPRLRFSGALASGVVATAMMVVFLSVQWPASRDRSEFCDTSSIVRVGRRLAGIDGVMFVSASGALPFYSGWRSVDKLGLNSEEIAHKGLTVELLDRIHPDLVVIRSTEAGKFNRHAWWYPQVKKYLATRGFTATSAVRTSGQYHLVFFVRGDSPFREEITERLLTVEGVEYGDVAQIVDVPTIAKRPSGANGRET